MPPLLLAVRHIPFPGVHRPRVLPSPDVLTPIARRLEELAAAAAAHPLLKPLFAAHSHLSSFAQSRRRLVAARRDAMLSGEHCFAAVLGDSVAGVVVANASTTSSACTTRCSSSGSCSPGSPTHRLPFVAPLSTICGPVPEHLPGHHPAARGTLDLSPILAFPGPQRLHQHRRRSSGRAPRLRSSCTASLPQRRFYIKVARRPLT
ncbi:hypothetical protein HU200_048380 [Digitaria exilis]|uniref:Uncharacterized protein n=1 Tax=Digitaria exilis TaxID=1010633 RepID=A0A835B0W7_9POAL|nr:hypothetical protein HU200_048380 [Digitaria exilis]